LGVIEAIFELLQEFAAAIAFRISQVFQLSDRPKTTVAIQFAVFAFVVIPLFVALVFGLLWLVF
jgi:hypothetical protein